MLYPFFWAITRRLHFMCRCFGTLCSIFIGGVSTECSQTSPHKIQTRGITQKKEYNTQNTAKVWNQESISHIGREYFRRKQLHNFRISENCYSFLPPTYVILDFTDTIWQKPNPEIVWTLRQISDCIRRPFYQISTWYIHQNTLNRHSEKLTHNNLYCFIDWFNPTVEFYCYFIRLQAKNMGLGIAQSV